MSQIQLLGRSLVAAGFAPAPEGSGLLLLFVEDSTLISKVWANDSFSNQELLSNSVRPNSTAAYVENDSDKVVICVSPDNALRVLRYNEDEEDWADDESAGAHTVHPDGKVTATFDENSALHIVFQDPSNHLVHLDSAWKRTILPADAVVGTPLSASIADDGVVVYYVSARDRKLHTVSLGGGNKWSDETLDKYAVGDANPKQFLITTGEGGELEVYLLDEKNQIIQLTASEKGSVLGKVDETGKVTLKTAEECVIYIIIRCHRCGRCGCRRRCCW